MSEPGKISDRRVFFAASVVLALILAFAGYRALRHGAGLLFGDFFYPYLALTRISSDAVARQSLLLLSRTELANKTESLIRENRQYTAGYLDRSLDQPLGRDGEEGFCLYDTLSASSSGGIAQVEERVMLEQFLDTLPHRERRLLRLLQEGYSASHIAGELALEEEEVYDLAREVGRKRRAFFQED